jgi:hypothetical protein
MEQAIAAVAQHLGWNAEDLAYAVGASRLKLATPGDFRDEHKLAQLQASFELLKRFGVAAPDAWAWTRPSLAPKDAAALRRAVRAWFDECAWLEHARPLRDALRVRQRDALVSFLVSRDRLRDANDLYGLSLIDVEMDPCMLISRLKQAASSIQLFVQRCLMNLEEEEKVAPSAIDLQRWNWMKNYRVWEANRKVFVYPENWIEPELREDKSPFFRDLESELLQGEVTDEKAEKAFRGYLEKLDEVARLEIVGMYHDKDDSAAIDVLHVFGRTNSTPHVYLPVLGGRQLLDGLGEGRARYRGDHLIPWYGNGDYSFLAYLPGKDRGTYTTIRSDR